MRGARAREFEDLGDLDDRGGQDDGDAERFGDGEFEAGGVGGVEVVDEVLVAGRAEEGGCGGAEGGGKVVGEGLEGLEGGAEGVHCGGWVGVLGVLRGVAVVVLEVESNVSE